MPEKQNPAQVLHHHFPDCVQVGESAKSLGTDVTHQVNASDEGKSSA